MILKVLREELVEVGDDVDVDEFHDSLMDDTLDGQGSGHETSDGKFEYVPLEIVNLITEKVK